MKTMPYFRLASTVLQVNSEWDPHSPASAGSSLTLTRPRSAARGSRGLWGSWAEQQGRPSRAEGTSMPCSWSLQKELGQKWQEDAAARGHTLHWCHGHSQRPAAGNKTVRGSKQAPASSPRLRARVLTERRLAQVETQQVVRLGAVLLIAHDQLASLSAAEAKVLVYLLTLWLQLPLLGLQLGVTGLLLLLHYHCALRGRGTTRVSTVPSSEE